MKITPILKCPIKDAVKSFNGIAFKIWETELLRLIFRVEKSTYSCQLATKKS